MKRIFFQFALISVLALGAHGQVLDGNHEPEQNDQEIKTLFGKDRSNGGYFDIYFNYTEIKQTEAVEIGSRISMIVGHSLAFGLEGTGFVSNVFEVDNNDYIVAGGYGGFSIEPIVLPKYPVHVSFPVMLGGGASVYSSIDTDYSDEAYVEEVEGFLIARPGMEIEFNITRNFRFCLNGYYRFIADVGPGNFRSVNAGDLDGLSLGFSFKIGKF